ncbi:hypothetical protein V9T40_003618 [Parthenolecanium corni]|uniref:Uncharacterized protein n=1 Tax=Parthenolecanium corni TaxID=536013 RepID=A0AAN9Y9W1_9HEMI
MNFFQNTVFTQAKPFGCGCKSIDAYGPIGAYAPPPLAPYFGCGFPAPLPPPIAFAPFPHPVPVRVPPPCPPPSVTIPNIILALLPPQRPISRPVLPFLPPPPPPAVVPIPQPYPVPFADPGVGCGCY